MDPTVQMKLEEVDQEVLQTPCRILSLADSATLHRFQFNHEKGLAASSFHTLLSDYQAYLLTVLYLGNWTRCRHRLGTATVTSTDQRKTPTNKKLQPSRS